MSSAFRITEVRGGEPRGYCPARHARESAPGNARLFLTEPLARDSGKWRAATDSDDRYVDAIARQSRLES